MVLPGSLQVLACHFLDAAPAEAAATPVQVAPWKSRNTPAKAAEAALLVQVAPRKTLPKVAEARIQCREH